MTCGILLSKNVPKCLKPKFMKTSIYNQIIVHLLTNKHLTISFVNILSIFFLYFYNVKKQTFDNSCIKWKYLWKYNKEKCITILQKYNLIISCLFIDYKVKVLAQFGKKAGCCW